MEGKNTLKFKGRWNIVVNKDFLFFKYKDLTDKSKFLYVCLKSFVNSATETAFPSLSFLSSSLGWNIKTVSAQITRLEKLGLLQKKQIRNGNGRFSHNEYLLIDELDWLVNVNNPQNQ